MSCSFRRSSRSRRWSFASDRPWLPSEIVVGAARSTRWIAVPLLLLLGISCSAVWCGSRSSARSGPGVPSRRSVSRRRSRRGDASVIWQWARHRAPPVSRSRRRPGRVGIAPRDLARVEPRRVRRRGRERGRSSTIWRRSRSAGAPAGHARPRQAGQWPVARKPDQAGVHRSRIRQLRRPPDAGRRALYTDLRFAASRLRKSGRIRI